MKPASTETPEVFISSLRARSAAPRHRGAMSGRGIVTCAGGASYFINAYVLARVLRETLGCRLPIQLWHFGGDEISSVMRHLLARLDVEFVDATAVLVAFPADIRDGWQLKPYAILHSRFQDVLYLDADQVPTRDPEFLFETVEFTREGAVFWPDIMDLRADNPIWAATGLVGETCPSWESGQMLIDKGRNWPALQVALCLNERADAVYRMIYGDKDTFLVAWRFAGAKAAVVSRRPFTDDRVLIQRDFGGAPLFQHRTGAKWTYDADQYRLDGFQHMDACLGFLADLRAQWNGRLFFPPDRSIRARAEEARLEATRGFRFIAPGECEIELELLPGHQIGAGRHPLRQNWHVAETTSGLELRLLDGDLETFCFHWVGSGVWQGQNLRSATGEATIHERPIDQSDAAGELGGGLIEALIDASGFHAGCGEPARDGLVGALRLLLRAEPGLWHAMQRLSARSGDFLALANDVMAGAEPRNTTPVSKAIDVIRNGYVAAER